MDTSIKTTLHSACAALLRPVALVLLRGGMTWKEFADLSKSVFVSVATDEFGIRGRPTNVSRVSILTGISRKEVKRQRDLLAASEAAPSSKTTDATRLLTGWYRDPRFSDEEGNPLPLAAEGPENSFEALFRDYGGDTPKQTLVKELQNAGSIAQDDRGRFIALRRYHMPADLDDGYVRFFGTNMHDHAKTLANNLQSSRAYPLLEGFAVDDRVHPDAAEEFRAYLDKRGEELLEEIDNWLTEHRVPDDDVSTTPVRLGLGVYAIEGPLPKGTLS